MVIANFHSSLKHKFSSNILRNKYGKMYGNNSEQQIVSKILNTRDILAHFTLPNLPSLISLVLSSPFLIYTIYKNQPLQNKKEFGGMATYLSALGTSCLDMI